jgi:glycosyltransferase involved in cell wall biosynthesis
MLSVVIPTYNSEEGLARTLASLVSAAAEGVIREVVVVDAGSTDGTLTVAEAAGCLVVNAGGTWGDRLGQAIAAMRRAPWIMLLPPQVLLEGDWFREVSAFVERSERANRSLSHAASFRLEFDEFGVRARLIERTIVMCSQVCGLPMPEQGLVFSRKLWDRIRRDGQIADYNCLVNRIGRRHIRVLRAHAVAITTDRLRSSVPSLSRLAAHMLASLGVGLVIAEPGLGDRDRMRGRSEAGQ